MFQATCSAPLCNTSYLDYRILLSKNAKSCEQNTQDFDKQVDEIMYGVEGTSLLKRYDRRN